MKTDDIQNFLGLDVGKTDNWACAVTKDCTKIWNRTLPNDEAKLTKGYQDLSAKGMVLVVVDQPATIGALAVAVAQRLGIMVAYLPGLTMRRIADMYQETAKTDEKDAFIIARAARTMPHTLHSLHVSDEEEATLGMLTGFDLDLARRASDRCPAGLRRDLVNPRCRAHPSSIEACWQSQD
ncbi:IS110 family transposase [Glutamicibacter nicotianae]|uniref:IS110 family transposase n=1 Tax=Glutamicibacter nicotianae TaxID=37929 RepID=UPI003B3ABC77